MGARSVLMRIVVWWSIFTALTGMIYPSKTWPLLVFSVRQTKGHRVSRGNDE